MYLSGFGSPDVFRRASMGLRATDGASVAMQGRQVFVSQSWGGKGVMKRSEKYRLLREFGLCEILSQSEPMATGTLKESGHQVLLYLPFLKRKEFIPIRFITNGDPAAATMVRETVIENVQFLSDDEKAKWLARSLELRVIVKAREAAEAEKTEELASV